jgi:hypothetical protein
MKDIARLRLVLPGGLIAVGVASSPVGVLVLRQGRGAGLLNLVTELMVALVPE